MSDLISAFPPIAMMVLLLSLGLRLPASEALRTFRRPRALVTGLLVQVIGMPLIAFTMSRLTRLDAADGRTVMMEATMQNVAITIFVTNTLLGDTGLAIPGLIYAVEMNLVALLIIGGAHVAARRAGLASSARP